MPDLEKIKKHLASLIEAVTNLEKYKGITEAEITNNLDKTWILERGIYISIQNLFDMFAHIVSADLNINWDSFPQVAEIV